MSKKFNYKNKGEKIMERFYAIISLSTVRDWDIYQDVIRFISKFNRG